MKRWDFLYARVLLWTVSALLAFFASSAPAHAFNELLVGSFLDDGVAALARGGLEKLPREQESLDFSAPLFLDSKGRYLIETGYESQPTARIHNGAWQGSRADSERLDTAVAAPFSLRNGALKGSVAAGYGYDFFQVKADNAREGTFVGVNETVRSFKGGVHLSAWERVSLGVSLIGTDYRNYLEVPLELAVAPTDWLTLGYQHSYSDFDARIDLTMMGHQGTLPLKLPETLDELYGVLDCRALRVKYAQELKTPENRRIEGRLLLPGSLYLVGEYRHRDFAPIDQDIEVDGLPGGTLKAALKRTEYRAGIGARLSSRWSVEANYRHGAIAVDGGGIASSRAVAGFWPSLLVGNYNYLASASLESDQYHIAAEYRGDRFSFGLGAQYLDLRPNARVDYWRGILFGLGRAGEETKQLTVDRIGMLFLAAGVGYTWRNFELRYAVGQFIPVWVHDTDQAGPAGAPASGGGGGGDIFSRLGDKIARYPGGGIQRLLLSATF
jgi:hypothetical protein